MYNVRIILIAMRVSLGAKREYKRIYRYVSVRVIGSAKVRKRTFTHAHIRILHRGQLMRSRRNKRAIALSVYLSSLAKFRLITCKRDSERERKRERQSVCMLVFVFSYDNRTHDGLMDNGSRLRIYTLLSKDNGVVCVCASAFV